MYRTYRRTDSAAGIAKEGFLDSSIIPLTQRSPRYRLGAGLSASTSEAGICHLIFTPSQTDNLDSDFFGRIRASIPSVPIGGKWSTKAYTGLQLNHARVA